MTHAICSNTDSAMLHYCTFGTAIYILRTISTAVCAAVGNDEFGHVRSDAEDWAIEDSEGDLTLDSLVTFRHQQKCNKIALPGASGKLRPDWWTIAFPGIGRHGATNLVVNREGIERMV